MKIMKILLTTLTVLTAMTGTAFAYDNPQVPFKDQYDLKAVVLENQSQFNASVTGTSFVFKNVPNDLEFGAMQYDEIYVSIIQPSTYETVRDYTHTKSSGSTFNIDLSGLPNGIYEFLLDYKFNGEAIRSYRGCVSVSLSNGTAKLVVPDLPSKNQGWYLEKYRTHIQHQIDERKDAYALDSYKRGRLVALPASTKLMYQNRYNEAMRGVPAGASDIVKMKAIADYVRLVTAENVEMDCNGASRITGVLGNMAGIPVKEVTGETDRGSHMWTRVWLEGRWMSLDAYWYGSAGLDMTEAQDTITRTISPAYLTDKAWDGALSFYAVRNNKFVLLKKVPNFPLDGLLKETYGYNAANLYKDANYTLKFDLARDRINGGLATIIVNESGKNTVCFDSNGGSYFTAIEFKIGSKIVKPANPVRKGYKFVGWYKDDKLTKVWNFSTDKLIVSTTLYAKWTK